MLKNRTTEEILQEQSTNKPGELIPGKLVYSLVVLQHVQFAVWVFAGMPRAIGIFGMHLGLILVGCLLLNAITREKEG